MTLDETIEVFKLDKHETLLNVSGLYNINIITWLEELKEYRKQSVSKEAFEKMKTKAYKKGFRQGRADAIEDFIKEHTSLNFRGEPYIFITNTEYEHLKEQK